MSASRNPGRDSSHWLVLMGICFRRRVPGFVVDRPRFVYWIRMGLSILSIVDGEIFSSALMASGAGSPKHSLYPGSQIDNIGLRRFEQGRLAASQISFKGLMIASLL